MNKEIEIPNGYEARIEDNKVVFISKESEDERIRRTLAEYFGPEVQFNYVRGVPIQKVRDWLEKQKEEEGYEAIPVESTLEYKLGFKRGKESEKQKEQKSAEWSEEDSKRLQRITDFLWYNRKGDTDAIYQQEEDIDWLKSLRPQPKDKTYKEKDEAFKLGKHQLALSFMSYLDENRPEVKMSLSNSECEDIDKAFKENDWAKIMRYYEKYRPHWKPSEEQM